MQYQTRNMVAAVDMLHGGTYVPKGGRFVASVTDAEYYRSRNKAHDEQQDDAQIAAAPVVEEPAARRRGRPPAASKKSEVGETPAAASASSDPAATQPPAAAAAGDAGPMSAGDNPALVQPQP